MKIVIVGGVAGGASAAARIRRLDENSEIIMFERGEYISFANCGLPYYIGGTIEERDDLLVQTPEDMKDMFGIDVRIESEVTAIDRDSRTVLVRNRKTGREYRESYDRIILSPGAVPVKPPIPGIDLENIFTLRTVPDTDAIKEAVDSRKGDKAVVVGGGFIGLEMAENLHSRGMDVSIVEAAEQVMAPIDYEMACMVHNHILSKGVKLYLKDGVKAFHKKGRRVNVELQSGKTVAADMVILAIGVKPDIYAVGDAIEVKDFVNGGDTVIPLAGPASKQGRTAANNICGANEEYKGTQGTSVVKVFDLTVAATGSSEKLLKRMGIEHDKCYTESNSHAGYYPGASPMNIKLLYAPDGKVIGAQIVGYDGVDKRIDVLASAVRFGKTVYDLEELELAYAPPYSSAKDPVNMAGYVAANQLKGDVEVIHWHGLNEAKKGKYFVLDVRLPEEAKEGFIGTKRF